MPAGDPAGYLPSVQRARAAGGASPYRAKSRRKRAANMFPPRKGVRRGPGAPPQKGFERPAAGAGAQPPFSMTSRPTFASSKTKRKLFKPRAR